MTLPASVRILSAVLGLAVALVQLVPGVQSIVSDPIVAAGQFAVAVPFLIVFSWVAAWPDHADRTLRRRYGIDLSDGRTVTGVLVHVVFVYLVFGGTVLATTRGLDQLITTGEHPARSTPLTGQSVVANLVLNLVLFVVAAVTWLWLVDDRSGREFLEDLRLEIGDLPRGIVAGVLVTVAGIVVLAGLGYLLQQMGIAPENPQAEAIANALTPVTAVLVAMLAGLGEEIYFRGFLLPRTGNLLQAGLFGALHATYLTPFQVILPFALGLAFGWVTRKTSLWSAIVAHVSFNGVMLLSSIYADELASLAAQTGLL